MDVSIQFLGAARTVTGSKHLLTLDHDHERHRILFDCGLFQGLKELRLRNRDTLPVRATDIDAVVLTHAHIDHIGYLPRLYQEGFRGRILCTAPTQELLEIMLLDSARLQEEEASYANQKGYSRHHPAEPLYTVEDACRVFPLVEGFELDTVVHVTDELTVVFREAGHILGSAIVEAVIKGEHQHKRIVFSGDLGRYDNPVLFDPARIPQADVLVVESTYGDRVNRSPDPEADLARVINDALARGGVLTIAAFALGRTQTLLYYLRRLRDAGRVPRVPIYLDSPMSIRVTGLFPRYPRAHRFGQGDLFDIDGLHVVHERWESKRLNELAGNAIIVSASGMATGGRILHHLYHRLPRPQDTLVLVGYQAAATRGQLLLEGATQVKMFGEQVPVRCHIKHLDGFSAHADRPDLLRWLGGFSSAPKRTFIVHGEPASADALAETIRHELGWANVTVPEYLEADELFRGI
jgi:metallo-beta-lactamase family protein